MACHMDGIIWTNAGILLIGPLGTKFGEISTEIYTFSFKKMHLKMSSEKWRSSCLGLNVLTWWLLTQKAPMKAFLSFFGNMVAVTLKRKCCHFDEIFITGCTGSCQNDNFQCSQWWKFHQNNNISVSVYDPSLDCYLLVRWRRYASPLIFRR